MEEKKLRRSCDKMVAGVCAGVADYFNIDPVIVRIIFVLLTMAGGNGILLYIILWIIMPECPVDSAPPSTTPPAR